MDANHQNYCDKNSIPDFRLIKTNGEVYKLTGEIPEWANNGLYIIQSMTAEQILPEDYTLMPAYPNPFNPTTTIDFSLPMESSVSVVVYNVEGREVTTLINRNMDAGYHSIRWNAAEISSGVYYVKLIAADYTMTQKLMLIK